MTEDQTVLTVHNVSLNFGGVQALIDVSFEVRRGEVLAIIGPNGAGKTCMLNCVNGFYRPQKGDIFFEGRRITRMPSHQIAELGIARTFQQIELYTHLSAQRQRRYTGILYGSQPDGNQEELSGGKALQTTEAVAGLVALRERH